MLRDLDPASSEKNKNNVVEAGAMPGIKEVVLEVPTTVQSERTACMAAASLPSTILPGIP